MFYAPVKLPKNDLERPPLGGGPVSAGFQLGERPSSTARDAGRDDKNRSERDLARHIALDRRRADLDGASHDLRSMMGRFLQLKSNLVTLLGQAVMETSGLFAALALAQSLLARADQERGRAGWLQSNASNLRGALESAAREAERISRDIVQNAQHQRAVKLDLSAVQGQMQALQSIIQALLAEIAALMSQTRS